MAASSTPHETAQSVLAVLAGVPLSQAAAQIRMEPDDLADAIEVYQAAGYAALQRQAAGCGWYQARVQFTDWNAAEHVAAADLCPHLTQMHDQGVIAQWWFIRKAPWWRLRLLPGRAGAGLTEAVSAVLDRLMAAGLIERWQESIYEPESAAFGGTEAMDIAHALFHADSHSILSYALRPVHATPDELPVGRRELSLLLCAALMHGAGQDWHEQGDVWHRTTQLRPLPPTTPADRIREMTSSLHKLLTTDTRPGGPLFRPDGPLAFAAPWAAAFDAAGRALGEAAASGTLERGLRSILAHHVIFHWNRLGLTSTTQSILAHAARDTILDEKDSAPDAHPKGDQ